MTWLLWRQHRFQAAVSWGVMLAFAVLLWITGVHMADLFRSCRGSATCSGGSLFHGYAPLENLVTLTIAAPLVLGVLWAAPLIGREFEAGTHTLAWTQSVTRRHWLTSKLAVLIGGTLLWSGALAAVVTWWSGPLNSLHGNRFDGASFDTQGVLPIAYSLFAVSLGVAAGAVLRRMLPALGVTIFGFVAVRILVDGYVRPLFQHPLIATSRLDQDPASSGAWVISRTLILHGQTTGLAMKVPGQCAGAGDRSQMDGCLSDLGYRLVTKYQPANRFWPFQFIESAIFIGLAALLVAVCVIVVRRRDA
jgi:hypothetical protein